MKKLFIYIMLLVFSYGNNDLYITGTEVNASCEKIGSDVSFRYSNVDSFCPATTKAEALLFLHAYNYATEEIPECQMPTDLENQPGIILSEEVPLGYELVEENTTSENTIYYHAYPESYYSYILSGNGGIEYFDILTTNVYTEGIRTNASITSGSCNADDTQAEINFKADIYNGVIQKRSFVRHYIPSCEEDSKFPNKPNNSDIVFIWDKDNQSLTEECNNLNGTIQTRIQECNPIYRCIKKTEEPSPICDESISSYVSPSDQTFHEDISITGVNFGLHYSSSNIEVNQSKTIAYGWSISSHSTLNEDKLTLGSGSLWIVEATSEGNLSIVQSGSSELIFDINGKHLKTRDLYTKETSTTFSYDNEDRVLSITDKYGQTSYLHRDANGVITSIVAPKGQITYLSVDVNGDLVEVQYEDTSSYTFAYENHLMTIETEPNTNVFLHFFDAQGRVVKVIDAEQGEWDFGTTSDTISGIHTVTRASGDVITYKKHFLANGILKTEKTLATGDIIVYENTIDDSVSSTTTCGQKSTNTYLLKNGTLAKDPLTNKRILASSTQTTASGLSKTTHYNTHYTFNANNTLLSIENTTSTNGATTTILRDYKQNTSIHTSAEGRVTTSTFDPITQDILTSQSENLKPITYIYDTQGKVLQSTQGERTTSYTYDTKGKLQSLTDPKGQTTSYSYDLRDRPIQITYADGTRESYEYDANSNLVTRTIPTPTNHTFTYNGVNKKISTNSPLQKQTTYTYDKQRRITTITKPSAKTIDTTYTNGRITAVSTTEGTTNYAYLCQSKLSNIDKGSENLSFIYDGTLLTSITQVGELNQVLSYSYNPDFLVNAFTYANQTENYL